MSAPVLPEGDLRPLVVCRYDYGSGQEYQRWVVLRLDVVPCKLALFAFHDDALTERVDGDPGTWVELFSRRVFWSKDCTAPKEIRRAIARFFNGVPLNQGLLHKPDFDAHYDRANALRHP